VTCAQQLQSLCARTRRLCADIAKLSTLIPKPKTLNPKSTPSAQTEQMRKIWAICGTPTKENWPNHETLPVSLCVYCFFLFLFLLLLLLLLLFVVVHVYLCERRRQSRRVLVRASSSMCTDVCKAAVTHGAPHLYSKIDITHPRLSSTLGGGNGYGAPPPLPHTNQSPQGMRMLDFGKHYKPNILTVPCTA